MTDLMPRVAIVTGAASGIGRGIAERLAAATVKVAVCDIDAKLGGDVAASLPDAVYVSLDVTSADSVEAGVSKVVANLGTPAILVNCAGADVVKPFLETDETLWTTLIELNLLGVIRMTKAVLPHMVESRYGRVVNIGSDAARVGSSGEAVYSAAKGGIIGFGKTVAREMARHGITVNTVCPGPTFTPQMERMLGDGGERYIDAMKRGIPMRRLGAPGDVAGAVAYLTSEEAGYVTGQTLSVSGGLSMV